MPTATIRGIVERLQARDLIALKPAQQDKRKVIVSLTEAGEQLVRDRMAAFPASGEINSKLELPAESIARVEHHFALHALEIDRTDGISMSFPQWRFNLRSSNTEPVVRLNVESRADVPLMEARTQDILALLKA